MVSDLDHQTNPMLHQTLASEQHIAYSPMVPIELIRWYQNCTIHFLFNLLCEWDCFKLILGPSLSYLVLSLTSVHHT
jgi:hypothetical protein